MYNARSDEGYSASDVMLGPNTSIAGWFGRGI